MKNTYSYIKQLLNSQKIRIVALFAILVIVAAIAVLGYTYDYEGGEYGYDEPYYGGYHYYAPDPYEYDEYYGHDNNYEYDYGYDDYVRYPYYPYHPYYASYGDVPYVYGNMVSLEDGYVYMGDLEYYDYERGLMIYGDYVYRIDEYFNALRIGPRMNIGVTFVVNPAQGEYDIGNDFRLTNYGTPLAGWVGYDPGQGMPPNPRGLGLRIFMGWNKQADGLGEEFTGTTVITGPINVYAQWGFQVRVLGAGLPSGGAGPWDTNYYGPRIIREGWSFIQQEANWGPGNVAWPANPPPIGPHNFVDWYNAAVGGTPWTSSMPITTTMAIHARWPAAVLARVDFDPVLTTAVIAPSPPSPPAPSSGLIQSDYRMVRPGTTINFSGQAHAAYGLSALNLTMANRRSAPTFLYPTSNARGVPNKTLEGWWTEPGGWDTPGNERFSSPGSPEDNSGTMLPIPAAWSETPVYDDMTVYAHWVYRVTFIPTTGGGGGFAHPLPPLSPNQPAPTPAPGHLHHFYNAQLWSAAWTFGPTGPTPLFRDVRIPEPGDPTPTIFNDGIQRNVFTDEPEIRNCVPDETFVSRPGHMFNGWWILPPGFVATNFSVSTNPDWPETIGAVRFCRYTTPITESMRVYAHWIPSDFIYLTFDAGGGHFYRNSHASPPTYPRVFYGAQTHVIRMRAGNIAGAMCGTAEQPCHGQPGHGFNSPPHSNLNITHSISMPTHPRREGFIFIGWYDFPCPYPNVSTIPRTGAGSFHFNTGVVVNESRTVHAHWARYMTIHLQPNGGTPPPAGPGPIGGPVVAPPTGTPGQPAPLHPGQAGQPNALPSGPGVPASSAPYRRIPIGFWHTGVPFSFATFQTNTMAAGTLGGVRPYYTLTYGPFGIVRPGFSTMAVQWEWPWFANTFHGGQGGAVWNTRPRGDNAAPLDPDFPSTGHVWAATTHTNFLASPELAETRPDGSIHLNVYLQWGLNVTFFPNTESIGIAPTAIQAPSTSPHFPGNHIFYRSRAFSTANDARTGIAAGYSFNTRLRTYIGPTPPTGPIMTHPPHNYALWEGGHLHTIPYYSGFWPTLPVANHLTFTQRFPDPRPGGNWAPVATAVGDEATFVGWNTRSDGSGDWIVASTIISDYLPLRNAVGEVVVHPGNINHLYGIWERDSISFSCGSNCDGHQGYGNGPCDPDLCLPTGLPGGRLVPPFRIPLTDTTTWQQITQADGWPPNPTPRPDMEELFLGWFTSLDQHLDDTLRNSTDIIPGPFHFYARWGMPVFFDPNGGALTGISQVTAALTSPLSQFQLNQVNIPIRGAGTQDWRFGRWNVLRSGLGTPIIGSSTTPLVAGSPLVQNIPLYPPTVIGNEEQRRTVFAQWDGLFYFNLNGGRIGAGPGSNTNPQVWTPEGFTISQTSTDATNSLPVNLPPSPAPNHNISNLAAVPNNPSHDDPSLVFMGWRVVGGPMNGQIFSRGDVATQIVMNGLVPDPNNLGENVRNAPTGRITLEAVWHQRLVFTKTGELLYTTNDTDARAFQPRDGAVFEIRRYNTVTNNWDLVINNYAGTNVSNIVTTSGNLVPLVGTETGNLPFAINLPAAANSGRVVSTLPFTPNGQYRLIELTPPVGYMREGGHWNINLTLTPAGDVRVESLTEVGHHLFFVNRHQDIDPNPARANWLQDFHVGNRRPRLTFTKLNSNVAAIPSETLCGAYFVLEWYNEETNLWVVYNAKPSGYDDSPIPRFPGQPPHPFPAPTLDPGQVLITMPFRPNTPAVAGQYRYRLREVGTPDGYLVPLGYWNITTNRYGGVETILAPTSAPGSVVPPFMASSADQATNPNHLWDVEWSVRNTLTRHWPVLKTDGQLHTPFNHEYLPGAVFMLFVYNGTGTPDANLMVLPSDMFGGSPGPWTYVTTQTSRGGPGREPMWFPMMPGRHYQLVEVLAPPGYQLPWGQWRITVTGAINSGTIAGTGLNWQVIGHGTPNEVPLNVEVLCEFIHATSPMPYNCNCNNGDTPVTLRVYHISNMLDFDLPLTGGTGASMYIAIIGSILAALSFIILFVYAGKIKLKMDAQ